MRRLGILLLLLAGVLLVTVLYQLNEAGKRMEEAGSGNTTMLMDTMIDLERNLLQRIVHWRQTAHEARLEAETIDIC
jgi:hypothetical protein